MAVGDQPLPSGLSGLPPSQQALAQARASNIDVQLAPGLDTTPQLAQGYDVILRDADALRGAIRDTVGAVQQLLQQASMYMERTRQTAQEIAQIEQNVVQLRREQAQLAGQTGQQLIEAIRTAVREAGGTPTGTTMQAAGGTLTGAALAGYAAAEYMPQPGQVITRTPGVTSPGHLTGAGGHRRSPRASDQAGPYDQAPETPTGYTPAYKVRGYGGQDVQMVGPGGGLVEAQDVMPGAIPLSQQTYAAGRGLFGSGAGYSLTGAFQYTAGSIARRLSEAQLGEDFRQTPEGSWETRNPGSQSWSAVAPGRDLNRRLALWGARSRALGGIKGAAGMTATEGLPGLATGLLKSRAGVVGAGVGAVGFFANVAEGQREANLPYQAVLGGTNAEGFVERVRERGFGLTQMGVMNDDQARQLYRGATELGLTGGGRERALDFATKEFRTLGMDVSESLQAMTVAARNGNISFSQLSRSLEGVSRNAREAGVNAQVARQQFLANYEAASRVATGPGSATVAAGLTGLGVGQGQRFQDVDVTGLTGLGSLRQQAALVGQSLPSYLAAGARNPGAFGQGQRQLLLQRSGTLLGQERLALIASEVQRVGGPNALRGADGDSRTREIANRLMAQTQLDPEAAMQVLSSAGVTGVTPDNAVEYLVRLQTGQANPLDAQARSVAESRSYGFKLGMTTPFKSRDEVAKAIGGGSERDLFFGGGPAGQFFEPFFQGSKAAARKARQAYFGGVRTSGQRNPLVENLLSDFDPDRRFKVRTKDGDREVDTITAIKHYQDQLQSGQAEIIGGTGAGQTVRDFLGMEDPTTKITSDKDKGRGAKPGSSRGETGRVTIEPSPELRRLFNFNTTGNAAIDAGRREGIPARPGYPPSLPGG